jgi:hypothetical protein
MSASTTKVLQKWLKGPWGRVAKTQMVKEKTTPSPRLCKPMSNEVLFMVFPVNWPGRRLFLEHKPTHRKRKMTSTPQVDVDELKR